VIPSQEKYLEKGRNLFSPRAVYLSPHGLCSTAIAGRHFAPRIPENLSVGPAQEAVHVPFARLESIHRSCI